MKDKNITLGDISDTDINRSGPSGAEFVYVDISSVDRSSKTIINPKKLKTSKAPSRAKQHLKSGDVLVSMTRPNLNAVALVPPTLTGAIGSTGFHVLRSKWVEPKFIFYLVQSREFIDDMSLRVQGALYPAVRPADISSFFLPPFSLSYQRSVVARLEELFSELDKGIESLKTAREQLKVYRQALLKHAFEGKLTEQWRKDNADKLKTADQLLERIKQEREARYQQQLEAWKVAVKLWEVGGKEGKKPRKPAGFKELPPIDETELDVLPELPQTWIYRRLAEIAQIGSGMSVSRNRKLNKPVEVPYLRVANVQRGSLALDEVKTMLIEEGQLEALLLEKWDVLFNEGGDRDKLGRGWIWESQIERCITQNHVFRATTYLGGEVHSKFVSHWGNTYGQNYFDKGGKQTTNLASINKTVLSMFPIPVPSEEEQEQIIKELEEKMSTLDSFEMDIDTSLTKSEALRQSILKKAFSGQLVPQDPNDEPASVLLERIAKEKEAAAVKAKKAKTVKKRTKKGCT
ncbi:MAG: restriction endonuclease subunit S [Candidatus Electrothrix sp. GW3-4]|uniref:restriction endonuclease subunit S n=1 Tax=Candidatus Electrothrix sp. GW3-4 TaxID=3126740 RepID=UPI0030CC242B